MNQAGAEVRRLKDSKAGKEDIDQAVAVLLKLKEQYGVGSVLGAYRCLLIPLPPAQVQDPHGRGGARSQKGQGKEEGKEAGRR